MTQLRAQKLISPTKRGTQKATTDGKLRDNIDNADDENDGDDDDDDDNDGDSVPTQARLKPPRYVLSIIATLDEPKFDLLDSDFEVRLATAYRVRMDELAERAIREEILLRRFHKIRRAGNISDQALAALTLELERENERIYIRRVREAVQQASRYVHRISSPSLRLELNVDVRRARLKKKMRRLNKRTRFLPKGFEYCFDLLIGIRAVLQSKGVTLQHRDLPNPWISVQGLNLDLAAILAEDMPRPECEIHWTVMASATRPIHGVRTSHGIKIYHDINLHAEQLEYVMGTSFSWYQAAFVQCFEMIPPENAYIQRLNWWDKMRFAFHGLIEVRLDHIVWKITGTLNPYDVENYLGLRGENVMFNTKTNELRLAADVMEIGMSNMQPVLASKDFLLVAGMRWESAGDPNDHLLYPLPSYLGPFIVDASAETSSAPWRAQVISDQPDPFAPFRATRLHWDFDLKIAPLSSATEVITLDNAVFSRFIKFGHTFGFPDVYIQPPAIFPSHPGDFSAVTSTIRFRLRSTNFNAAYWESRDVRDPVGFKVMMSALELEAGVRRRVGPGWKRSLGSLKADGIESLMFPSEDYVRFYDLMRQSATESSMQFSGTPFVVAPSLLLVSEKAENGSTIQRFTINGLRVTYTPPAAGLISSWMAAYEEWDNKGYANKLDDLQSTSKVSADGKDEEQKLKLPALARTVSENASSSSSVSGERFFAHHEGHVDFLVQVKDAQIKLVTIVPPGAALLVAEDLELQIGTNAKKQRLARVIWREYEVYCSNRNDLWLDKASPSEQLPRVLTKCSMEFDIVNSSDEVVMNGDAEAKGSLTIVAPVLLAHMNPDHFNILRAVFGKFFVAQTSMSEQHKELLATIQYKLQLAPETVGDVVALRNRVRALALQIKDVQSMIRDLETEKLMGNLSPEQERRKKKKNRGSVMASSGARLVAALEKQTLKSKVCEHCGDAFILEAERVEVEDTVLHARCVVEYRTILLSSSPGAQADSSNSRVALLRQKLMQKQKTYQASSSLLNLLIEGQRKVKQGANALPTWKLSVRVEEVNWHMMQPGATSLSHSHSSMGSKTQLMVEDRMFCEVFLKFLTASILLREDDSGIIRMELNRVSILNHAPSLDNKYLHALQPLKAANWSDRDVMIRVFAAMRSPVGGIQVYDHFEFNVTPLRVSLTGDLWQSIYDYMFYTAESEKQQLEERRRKRVTSEAGESKAMSVSLRNYSDFTITNAGDVYYAYDETDYVRMRLRAEANRMFVYWKLTDIALLLTFRKGFAFENLKLALHSKEYRTLAGSWNDLVSLLQKDVLRDVLGQTGGFIKHAFTPKSQRDTDEVDVRPKSKLLTRLDGMGRVAHNVVTFGKGGKQRSLEEDRTRVQAQLMQNESLTESMFEQMDKLDEVIVTGERRDVEQQLDVLKAELLMGNLEKREAERQKLLKKKKKEEKEASKKASRADSESAVLFSPREPGSSGGRRVSMIKAEAGGGPVRRKASASPTAPKSPEKASPSRRKASSRPSSTPPPGEDDGRPLIVPSARRKTLFQGNHDKAPQTMFQVDAGAETLDVSAGNELIK